MFSENVSITTTEMHTAGEPVRIIESGYPKLAGKTILEKRNDAMKNTDHYRKLLMSEPRGHKDMYGALLVEPDDSAADLAVLFTHNEGFSTMCGHATIALARYAKDKGLGKTDDKITRINIQCPCGLVRTEVLPSGAVSFSSVPVFALALDAEIELPKFGKISLDVGYGGAFYCIVKASKFGLDVKTSSIKDIIEIGTEIKRVAKQAIVVRHPHHEELSFLYGTILTDDSTGAEPTWNICVFGDGQVDRSPTGSGVCARLAVQFARKEISLNEKREFLSRTGCSFGGRVTESNDDTVIVQVTGKAFYTGKSTFTAEKDDPLQSGFLLD